MNMAGMVRLSKPMAAMAALSVMTAMSCAESVSMRRPTCPANWLSERMLLNVTLSGCWLPDRSFLTSSTAVMRLSIS